jgi:hypothetical protein
MTRCDTGSCLVATPTPTGVRLHSTRRPDTSIEVDQDEWETFLATVRDDSLTERAATP